MVPGTEARRKVRGIAPEQSLSRAMQRPVVVVLSSRGKPRNLGSPEKVGPVEHSHLPPATLGCFPDSLEVDEGGLDHDSSAVCQSVPSESSLDFERGAGYSLRRILNHAVG
ncbi:hypothetical protein YTPLAS18_14270 [Nitrospira sp.]|nr:hypothetical protein YTPLAS18_14270 [Nitrospira sp.]